MVPAPDDLSTILTHQRDQVKAWRGKRLAEMREWLIERGRTKLH